MKRSLEYLKRTEYGDIHNHNQQDNGMGEETFI